MTRKRKEPEKKEPETILSATELQDLDLNMISEIQFRSTIMRKKKPRSTIMKLLVALEKSVKDSRDSVTVELGYDQAKIEST